MMGFKYQLATSDDDVFGEGEWVYQPKVGDELHISGNRRARVLAYVPVEKMGQFVDGGVCGLLEVERVRTSRYEAAGKKKVLKTSLRSFGRGSLGEEGGSGRLAAAGRSRGGGGE